MPNNLQTLALNYAKIGISTLPVRFREKTPDAAALIRAGICEVNPINGRPRATWEPLQKRLPSEVEIMVMFALHVNIGVVTGFHGLIVIDFDNVDLFFPWYEKNPLNTRVVLTSRGVHVYLMTDEYIPGRKAPGIDIKAAGGYVLAPPSIHPSGAKYQVLLDNPILWVPSVNDLLPAALFNPVIPSKPTIPVTPVIPSMPDNPWESAESPAALEGMDLIHAIKDRYPILGFFPDAESSDGGRGRWYLARCPFHDDHHPSFWIDAHLGFCSCHTCGMRPMDIINYYARAHGIDNQAAIDELRRCL